MDVPNTLANAPASYLAIRLGAKRHNTTISTGHCASLDAIGYAAQFLVQGRADAALAGGTEEINPHVLWQLDAAGPQAVGKVPGEAAAVVLLQAEHETGADQRPHLARFGAWTNMLAPRSSPESLVQDVCCEALELAGLSPDKIRLTGLSASTPADLPVAEGVRKALCNGHTGSPRRVPAFSLQGLVGETLGTAGAVHAVAAVTLFATNKCLLARAWSQDCGRRSWNSLQSRANLIWDRRSLSSGIPAGSPARWFCFRQTNASHNSSNDA